MLPTAMAQFHTIFAMMVFSSGLDYIMGFCSSTEEDFSSAIIWWPFLSEHELCS